MSAFLQFQIKYLFQRVVLHYIKPYFRRKLKIIRNAKAVFNMKKNLFTNKSDLNIEKDLLKCYTWVIALNGDEI